MDPYAGNTQEPMTLHRYLYAGNNPVMNVDPSGEFFDLGSMSAALNIRSILTEMQLDFGLRAADAVVMGGQSDITGEVMRDAMVVFGTIGLAKAGMATWKYVNKLHRAKRLKLLKDVRKALESPVKGIRLEGQVARRFKNELIDFQKIITDPKTGNNITDLDVVLNNVIIEVASGKKKLSQIKTQLSIARSMNKEYVVFAPRLGLHVTREVENLGVKVYRNIDKLETAVRGIIP